jgi:hypothetical protein
MDQFSTTCLGCGKQGHLEVIRGNFTAMGMNLCPDGFAFTDARSVDTCDEYVKCRNCGLERPLYDYLKE